MSGAIPPIHLCAFRVLIGTTLSLLIAQFCELEIIAFRTNITVCDREHFKVEMTVKLRNVFFFSILKKGKNKHSFVTRNNFTAL